MARCQPPIPQFFELDKVKATGIGSELFASGFMEKVNSFLRAWLGLE